MSEIQANKLSPASGTNVVLGDSSDTIQVPSGVTLDVASGGTLDVTGATVTGLTSGEINEPYFMARGTADQSIAHGTNVVLAFNTLVDSLDNASGYNTSSYRYTIQSGDAGLWYFEAGIYLQSMSDGNQNDIALWVNGSETFVERKKNGGSVSPYLNINAVKKYAVGDYIEARLFQNSGSSKNAVTQNSSSRFAGFRIKTL